MFSQARFGFIVAISVFAQQASAYDCASAAKTALWNSGNTPVTSVTTKTDSQGKKSTTSIVQTTANKYVQTSQGKWYVLNISIKELTNDFDTTKVTCSQSGVDTVNGEAASTYEIKEDVDDVMTDLKIWVSAKNLVVKAEGRIGDARYTTLYDYIHVVAPANAVTMGGK